MSVLIRGMEMPKSCADCRVRLAVGCCGNLPHNTRMPNCPLVPVPPHGDLIERKAVYDSLLNGMVMTGYQSRALDCINEFYVPTIIPAEEEMKNG